MKDLERMYHRAVEIISECIDGVEIYPVKHPITINTRATSRWGCVKYNRRTGERTMEISSRILADSVDDNATMNTVIHEVLHTCKGCNGHQGLWKRYANIINTKYPQYNIKTTASAEDYGLEDTRKDKSKYAVKCKKCGHIFYRQKRTAVIANPAAYKCNCGGALERVDVGKIKAEVIAPAPQLNGQMCFADLF